MFYLPTLQPLVICVLADVFKTKPPCWIRIQKFPEKLLASGGHVLEVLWHFTCTFAPPKSSNIIIDPAWSLVRLIMAFADSQRRVCKYLPGQEFSKVWISCVCSLPWKYSNNAEEYNDSILKDVLNAVHLWRKGVPMFKWVSFFFNKLAIFLTW